MLLKQLKIATLLIITSISMNAQGDAKSKAILDKLSTKTKAYKSIDAKFTWTIVNKDKSKNEQDGSIITKGDKYKLSIPGHIIYCNGATVWDFMADMNEVQVTETEESGDDAISPTSIFTIYENGFKYKFDSENATTQIINLYPDNPDKRKFHTVKLMINKQKQEISSVVMLMKDGTSQTYTIKSFTTNKDIPETEFSFNATEYPGVSVEDLR